MPEEIQNLLDKIQREAITKAEQEKEKILSAAKSNAAKIIADAEKEADEIVKKAKNEAELSSKRAVEAIKQAARDIIISLQNELLERLRKLVKQNVNEAMTSDFIKEIILDILKRSGRNADDLKIVLPKNRLEELEKKLIDSLAKDLKSNPAIFADLGIDSGFKISFKGEDLVFDLSDDAFADLICSYAGSRIAAILNPIAS